MARHEYGGGLADWTFGVGPAGLAAIGDVTIRCYSAEVGGVPYTDLRTMAGATVAFVVSSDGTDGRAVGTIAPFRGPDGVAELWVSGNEGPRARMVSTTPTTAVGGVHYNLGNVTGTVSINPANGRTQSLTLIGNVTTAAIQIGTEIGEEITLRIHQDATGGRTWGWQSAVKLAGAWMTPSTGPTTISIITLLWDGVNWVEKCRGVNNTFATPGSGGDRTEVSYAGSDVLFPNPQRGWYKYTETHFPTTHVPLDDGAMITDRVTSNITMVKRYVYLNGYKTTPISGGDLGLIATDFAKARAAGVKLIVRFAYTDTDGADATKAVILGHIAQLGPVLTSNADVIGALQAGFIGQWGEWYYTNNFVANPATPWIISGPMWADRGEVLAALLAAVPATLPVQVRYPEIVRTLYPSGGPANLGIHNDAFLASADDFGTYRAPDDDDWLAAGSDGFMVGGESAALNAPRSAWASAETELALYHWTYLNSQYHPDVLASWTTDNKNVVGRKLGYRIRLLSASVPAAGAMPGSSVQVRIRVVNDGWSAPVANRPVRLKVGSATTVTISSDVRTWQPGVEVELVATFAAPGSGTHPLALHLPDPAPALVPSAAYSIRCANPDVWNGSTGVNDLGLSLVIS